MRNLVETFLTQYFESSDPDFDAWLAAKQAEGKYTVQKHYFAKSKGYTDLSFDDWCKQGYEKYGKGKPLPAPKSGWQNGDPLPVYQGFGPMRLKSTFTAANKFIEGLPKDLIDEWHKILRTLDDKYVANFWRGNDFEEERNGHWYRFHDYFTGNVTIFANHDMSEQDALAAIQTVYEDLDKIFKFTVKGWYFDKELNVSKSGDCWYCTVKGPGEPVVGRWQNDNG